MQKMSKSAIELPHDAGRWIGERTGESAGPLLIILAQMHGNEPAGYEAAVGLFEAIDVEYAHNPTFAFSGRIVALRGNVAAARLGVRYQVKDLNRNWTDERMSHILAATSAEQLDAEDIETLQLLRAVEQTIADYPEATRVVVLDLHTTTAEGGIFSIPSHDAQSRRLALAMHAPVLHGFLRGLSGTTLHFFDKAHFPDVDITPVCFEAGQHNDPESPKLAMSAIINCFRSMGGFHDEDVEIKHERLLKNRAAELPKEARLVYTHRIEEGEQFKMREDKIYRNFDLVQKGELLASNRYGDIYAPYDGHILMPLYQKLGSDGFFIVEEMGKLYRRADDEHFTHSNAAAF